MKSLQINKSQNCKATVLPTNSDSELIFGLQLLSQILTPVDRINTQVIYRS